MSSYEYVASISNYAECYNGMFYSNSTVDVGTTVYESKALNEYITSDVDAPKNNDVMKVFAAAMQMASEMGAQEAPSLSPMETAMAVWNALKKMNMAYLVETGAMTVENVAEKVKDYSAVFANLVTEKVLNPKTIEYALKVAKVYVGISLVGDFETQLMVGIAAEFADEISKYVYKAVKPNIVGGLKTLKSKMKGLKRYIPKLSPEKTTDNLRFATS